MLQSDEIGTIFDDFQPFFEDLRGKIYMVLVARWHSEN